MRRAIALFLLLFLATVAVLAFTARPAHASEEVQMYVIASQLNGRTFPSKKSNVECRFDYGEIVTSTGNWSDDMKWVEVKGGENGTCWCSSNYLTERLREFTVENEHKTKIKIRSTPGGKVRSYLKPGGKLKITQVVLGWGKSSRGWVDLEYLIEIED